MYTLADFARSQGARDRIKRKRRRTITSAAIQTGIVTGTLLGAAGGIALARNKKFKRLYNQNLIKPYQEIASRNRRRYAMKPLEVVENDLVKKIRLKTGSGDQELLKARRDFFKLKKKTYRDRVVVPSGNSVRSMRRKINTGVIGGLTVVGGTTGGVLGLLTGNRINRSLEND